MNNISYRGLILCAGHGKRFEPVKPKETALYINKPVIVYGIESLRELGISDITLVVGEGKETIWNMIGDGQKYGVNITYKFQTVLDGDAGGIRAATNVLDPKSSHDAVFILFGDTVWTNLDDLIGLKTQFENFYNEPNYCGAIAFKKEPAEIPENSSVFPYGVGLIDKNCLIKELYEKPGPGILEKFIDQDNYCNAIAPAYVFKKDRLRNCIEMLYKVKNDNGEKHLSDAIKRALDPYHFTVSGYIVSDAVKDLGNPYSYLLAQWEAFKAMSHEDVIAKAREWASMGSNGGGK